MENSNDKHKVLEAFIRALIGLLAGVLPAVSTQNIPIAIGILGITGIISEVFIPRLIARIPGSSLKSVIAILIVFLVVSGVSFELYMRHDFYKYQNGYDFVIAHPDSKTPVKLRVNWWSNTSNGNLFVGEHVTYLGEKSTRKEIQLPERPDGKHFLVAFYRKVKTKSGKIGWIYGAYLR